MMVCDNLRLRARGRGGGGGAPVFRQEAADSQRNERGEKCQKRKVFQPKTCASGVGTRLGGIQAKVDDIVVVGRFHNRSFCG